MAIKTCYYARFKVTKRTSYKKAHTDIPRIVKEESLVRKIFEGAHPLEFELEMNQTYNRQRSLDSTPTNFNTISEIWNIEFFEQIPYPVYARLKEFY